jgi:glycosyltransferase involved in cell wall biosynthesis
MKVDRPLVSVVVAHLNQPDMLHECLSSLDAQTLERVKFEVIVVDNGSTLPPTAVIAAHRGTRLLEEREPGPGIARNRGVQAATGKVFAFIDADCRAHPDWLKVALATIDGSGDHTILGGDVQIWRGQSGRYSATEAYESVFAYRFKLYIERHGFSGTGNLVARRSDFERVGPFAGIDVAEDMDWGRRALEAGCNFRYVPNMIVYHPSRRSIGELLVKWDRHLLHAANTSDGTYWWKIRWIARAFAVLASPAVDWPKLIFTDRISGLSSRVKALFVLIVVRFYRFWRMLALLDSNEGVVWNREGRAISRDRLDNIVDQRPSAASLPRKDTASR